MITINRKRNIFDITICLLIRLKNYFYENYKLNSQRRKFKSKYPIKNPLITVYTPTYNRGKILKNRAIRSVLKQTYKKFEYIIIGDGCTDDTEKIVKSFKDKRIKFLNIKRKKRYPNQGEYFMNHWFVGSAYPANVALKKSKGNWIARLDDWAIWTPKHLEDLLKYAQTNDYEFVTGATRSKGKKHNGYSLKYLRIKKTEKNLRIGSHQTFFYRSYLKFFKYSSNSWRHKYNKVCDLNLLFRMLNAGVKFGWLNKIVTITKPRPGSKKMNSKAYIEYYKKNKDFYKFNE